MCLGLEVAVLVLTASDFKTLYEVSAIDVLQRFFRNLSKKFWLLHIRVLRTGLKPLKNMFIIYSNTSLKMFAITAYKKTLIKPRVWLKRLLYSTRDRSFF